MIKILNHNSMPVVFVLGALLLTYWAAMSNLDADINVVSNGKVTVEYNKKISQDLVVNGVKKTIFSTKEVSEEISLDCGTLSLKDCDSFYNKMDDTLGKPNLEAHIKKVLNIDNEQPIRIY